MEDVLKLITKVEDMTIDTFPITTGDNRANYQFCKEMLKNPADFRLVFFHMAAPERLHMKYAIIHYFEGTSISLLSMTVNEFTRALITAIKEGTMESTIDTYLQPEILLIDDIQHMAGKDVTQEELYAILKKRLESKKLTIILSEFSIAYMQGAIRPELLHFLGMATIPSEDSDISTYTAASKSEIMSWDEIVKLLYTKLGKITVDAWLGRVNVEIASNMIRLIIDDHFIYEITAQRCVPFIREAVWELYKMEPLIDVVLRRNP